MNKTVTINISGIIFHIEEDAFEKLSKYLNTIKGYFNSTEGGNEIMSDIEARIAEMLQTKINPGKQVILMTDVDAVIEIMGRPEEFAEGNSESFSATAEDNTTFPEPVKKRMFRDPDNKAIGGVCSGIAAYFDVDIVWIRLAMVLLVFFAGVSLWVYIILWIVIPEAKTTADKLAMRGEKIDINNISKTVKEEAEQIKKRMEKYGNNIRSNPDTRNFFDKLGDFLKDFLILFTKFFGRLIGLVLLIFGVMFMLGLMSTVFGFSIVGNNTEFNDWINLLFIDRSHYTLGLIGITLAFGIPVLMMIYGGVKLLFRIHYSNRWLNLGAGLIWLTGFLIALFVGITTGKDFGNAGKIKEQVQLQQSDTLYLTLNPATNIKNNITFYDEDEDERVSVKYNKHERRHTGRDNDYVIVKENGKKIIVGYANLNIVPSLTENFELYVIKKARGEDKRAALDRAKVIEYKVFQEGNKISFDEVFTVAGEEKFRIQDVQLILKVPRNKVIHLDQNLENFIDDVENVTNTYDGDMVGRRWLMGPKGLQCIDCEGLDKEGDADIFVHPEPNIDPGKVHVNSKDADVKIDEDGIKIKSKEGDVNITNKGIHIDTKGK